jgi:hypothetical protein
MKGPSLSLLLLIEQLGLIGSAEGKWTPEDRWIPGTGNHRQTFKQEFLLENKIIKGRKPRVKREMDLCGPFDK